MVHRPLVTRYYLLDVLRGAASLAVVLSHYQHFFYVAPGELALTFTPEIQPVFFILQPFYLYGGYAISLFFVLSGFVFFAQYLTNIGSGRVGPWRFFVLRFSRLYPLHVATLLLVAGLQWVSRSIDGQAVVYPCNDLYHFMLNLFFVSHWGLQRCWSFNAPVWSVSVEVLLYILFFVFAWIVPRLTWTPLTAALCAGAVGVLLHFYPGNTIGALSMPILCFYAGGIVYLLLDRLLIARWQPLHIVGAALGTIAIAAAVMSATARGRVFISYGMVFPAVIMMLAAMQQSRDELGKQIRILGDITYSTYLMHFPLQLSLLLAAKAGFVAIDYSAPGALVMFLALLIAISVPTYYLFEKGAQAYLRQTLSG